MIAGVLEVDAKGALFVRYDTRLTTDPIVRSIWYQVIGTQGNAYSGARPGAGDLAQYTGCVNARNEAARVVDAEIAPPKVRAGVQVRWSSIDQRWEKLGARGWICAEKAVR